MRDENCALCPLHEGAETRCIEGDGDLSAPVWIVGEAPGYEEDQAGLPFVGRSGRLLRTMLNELDYDADQVRITNAVRCRPPGNRDPEPEERKTCVDNYLFREMEEHKPRFVITVGAQPLQVFGKSGITRQRGQGFRYDVQGLVTETRQYKTVPDKDVTRKGVVHTVEVLPTFHPAYILRNRQHEPTLRADLATFKKIIDDRVANDYDGEYHECKTPKEVIAAYEALREATHLSADIETYGYGLKDALDPRSPGFRILSISFSPQPRVAYVLSVEHPITEHFGPRYVDLVKRIMRRLLCAPHRKLIWHNGKFDLKAIKHHLGFKPRMTYDTMLMARLLDENAPADLKDLARRYCGAGRYAEAVDWKAKDPVRTYVDPLDGKLKKANAFPEWDVLWPYNARDTDYALRIYNVQKEQVRRHPKLVQLFSKVSVPAANAAVDMELAGLWIDRERVVSRMQENGVLMRQAEARILEAVPTQDQLDCGEWVDQQPIEGSWMRETSVPRERFKVNSSAHIGWLLHELRGMPIMKIHAKTNAISVDKEVLTALQDKYVNEESEEFIITNYELLIAIEEYRKYMKWNSTYYKRWLTKMSPEGYYYHQYNPFAADTGRWTGDLQNTPRERALRSCIGAPDGELLIETDLAQIEMRLVAHAAQDKNLLRIFREGGDPHFEAAMEFFRVTADQIRANKEYRARAKPGNFGYLYGMRENKYIVFARNAYKTIFTYDEAHAVREGFFRKWAQVGPWHEQVKRFLHDHQYVESPLGRRRRLPSIMSDDRQARTEAELMALNAPIQGFASDICVVALVRIAEQIAGHEDEITMIMNNHDALAFRVKEHRARYWATIIRDIMRTPPLEEWFGVKLTVPIDADVTVGKYWGEPIKGFLDAAQEVA